MKRVEFQPPDWAEGAACRRPGIDPGVFYPESGDRSSARIAKWICGRCPVDRDVCREFGDRVSPKLGIFGGLNPSERSARRRELEQDQEEAA